MNLMSFYYLAGYYTEQEALDDLWYFPFGETPEHSLSEGRYL